MEDRHIILIDKNELLSDIAKRGTPVSLQIKIFLHTHIVVCFTRPLLTPNLYGAALGSAIIRILFVAFAAPLIVMKSSKWVPFSGALPAALFWIFPPPFPV